MDNLDVRNIIEVETISRLISHEKKLVEIFDEILDKVNIKINTEGPGVQMKDPPTACMIDMLLETDSSDSDED